ncbi:hypothetical protein HJG60_011982 [Phyllostomus discolor]|uniref:Uncharacterized protein n=1 Tax=Phyllostomus discolor TaxID=89673 RepID=A0A833ZLI8_9CHIR|nr:hypothetical protein HJG60_011982 [Phyllostomus discolor]
MVFSMDWMGGWGRGSATGSQVCPSWCPQVIQVTSGSTNSRSLGNNPLHASWRAAGGFLEPWPARKGLCCSLGTTPSETCLSHLYNLLYKQVLTVLVEKLLNEYIMEKTTHFFLIKKVKCTRFDLF